MINILALIIPLAFLYSPKVEKSKVIMVTQPLVITHERNTPAYSLYQQAQIVNQVQKDIKFNNLKKSYYSNNLSEKKIVLSTENVRPYLQTENLQKNNLVTSEDQQNSLVKAQIANIPEVVLSRQVLNFSADQQLNTLLTQRPDSTLIESSQFSTQAEGAIIRGQFELSEGVGIVDHQVVLKRVFEGQSIEIGQVDLRQGLYQIAVGSFEGEIVAEIKDQVGFLIGEGREKIFNLKKLGSFFAGPTLKLGKPLAYTLNSRSVDNQKTQDANLAMTLFSGHLDLKKSTDTFSNVSRYSSTLAVIQNADSLKGKNLKLTSQTGVATTLSVRTAADFSQTILFSDQWLKGSLSYLSEQLKIEFIKDKGVIIGRVVIDGKPARGAQVSVENQPSLEPYYLDQFLIPQIDQKSTSENGYFIIPGLNSGSYEVVVQLSNKIMGQQLFLVEEKLLTYQEITSSVIPTTTVARSFDAFTGEIIPSELMIAGQSDYLSLENDQIRFKHHSQSGLTEVINRPSFRDYASYTYIQNLSKDHLHLPQIKEAFIDYLKSTAKIDLIPDTSLFIGFTPQNTFDVQLADSEINSNQIIYFDRNGQIIPFHQAGGGFVVFNVPVGLQEIILQDPQTERTFSSVFYSRGSGIFVNHFFE